MNPILQIFWVEDHTHISKLWFRIVGIFLLRRLDFSRFFGVGIYLWQRIRSLQLKELIYF